MFRCVNPVCCHTKPAQPDVLSRTALGGRFVLTLLQRCVVLSYVRRLYSVCVQPESGAISVFKSWPFALRNLYQRGKVALAVDGSIEIKCHTDYKPTSLCYTRNSGSGKM